MGASKLCSSWPSARRGAAELVEGEKERERSGEEVGAAWTKGESLSAQKAGEKKKEEEEPPLCVPSRVIRTLHLHTLTRPNPPSPIRVPPIKQARLSRPISHAPKP